MKRFSLRNIEYVIVMALVSGCGASGSGADSGSAAKTVSAGADKAVSGSVAGADANVVDSGSVADADKTVSADAGSSGGTNVGTKFSYSWQQILNWLLFDQYDNITNYFKNATSGSDLEHRLSEVLRENKYEKKIHCTVDVYYYLNGKDGEKGWLKNIKFLDYNKKPNLYMIVPNKNGDGSNRIIEYKKKDTANYYDVGDKLCSFKNVQAVGGNVRKDNVISTEIEKGNVVSPEEVTNAADAAETEEVATAEPNKPKEVVIGSTKTEEVAAGPNNTEEVANADTAEPGDAEPVPGMGLDGDTNDFAGAKSIPEEIRTLISEKNTEQLTTYINEYKDGAKLHEKMMDLSLDTNFAGKMAFNVDVYYYKNGMNGEMDWLPGKEMLYDNYESVFKIKGARKYSNGSDKPIWYSLNDFSKHPNNDKDEMYNFNNVKVVLK